jgi:hypothetical protein
MDNYTEFGRAESSPPDGPSEGKISTTKKGRRRGEPIATYDYPDASGKLLYQVLRFEPKAFRQRRPDPDHSGRWINNLEGVERVPYRLDLLARLTGEGIVFVAEGEKDADRLIDLGLMATTCPMGAGKWRDQYNIHFVGKDVVILPDNDDPGREHAELVARSLASHALSTTILALPDLPPRGDISDWLDRGGSADKLLGLTVEAMRSEPSFTAPSNDPKLSPLELARPVVKLGGPPATKPRSARRGQHDRASVIAAMGRSGLAQFARELGLRLVGTGPDSKGWWPCRAIGREDSNPSATFNVNTGRYVDHGPSQVKLSIFDLAKDLAPGEYPDLRTAINKLGDRYIGERDLAGSGGRSTSGPLPVADRADPAEPRAAETAGDGQAAAAAVLPAVDVQDVRRRVLEVVASKDLTRLYGDAELLGDLGRVEHADPSSFAAIKADLSALKSFRARDFSKAIAQHLAPGTAVDAKGKGSDVGNLIEMGVDSIELFHDSVGKAYALTRTGDRLEALPLRGGEYKRLLTNRYYAATGYTPGPEIYRSALDVLELRACEGPLHDVHVRTAGVADPSDSTNRTVLLDLADEYRRAVGISKDGWSVVATPAVRFRRPSGMLPLPEPRRGGTIEGLWPFLNIREADRSLVLAWMTAALLPDGPFPILILSGEQGTAKSSTSLAIRRLIDPNVTPLRGAPADERELMIAATNSRVLAFDNLSHLSDFLSDCLCRIATGSGFTCRQLYTDNEEVFFTACRPILLNGIEEIAARGDLLQRSILVELPVVTEEARKIETRFWREFAEAQPSILGALLDLVAGGLAILPSIKPGRLPRMADFGLWGEAVSRATGRPDGEFLDRYRQNQDQASEIALESSPIAMAVVDLMSGRIEWVGTARGLLVELEDRTQAAHRRRNWPASPRGMAGALRRAAPALRRMGIMVDFSVASDRQRTRTITLRSAQAPTVT